MQASPQSLLSQASRQVTTSVHSFVERHASRESEQFSSMQVAASEVPQSSGQLIAFSVLGSQASSPQLALRTHSLSSMEPGPVSSPVSSAASSEPEPDPVLSAHPMGSRKRTRERVSPTRAIMVFLLESGGHGT